VSEHYALHGVQQAKELLQLRDPLGLIVLSTSLLPTNKKPSLRPLQAVYNIQQMVARAACATLPLCLTTSRPLRGWTKIKAADHLQVHAQRLRGTHNFEVPADSDWFSEHEAALP
jgi:hypothetical protein